ncbi:MAG: hypothetical protein EBV10_12320, partial [Synechococcaceae bacterium WB6_1A_059]|nr:hypothetical protein [Synechococcaceae bacterium WB6_1A_059]
PSYEGVCFQEQVNGKRRHPEYVSYNGEYIIQEYIEADLITIFGRIVNNEIYYDTIFDVKITEPPYCAEIEYSFPSKVCSKLVEEIYKNCSKFLDHIKLNNSPFLFDILVTKDQFFIIDFGMRVSTTPQPAIHAMCPNYSKEWVTSLLQQKRYKPKFTKSCVYKRPLFRPGIIESLEFQNYELLESYELPSKGTEILEPRNDNSLFPNGYMIAVADTKKEALDKIKKVENTFFIKYKDEVKTIKLST